VASTCSSPPTLTSSCCGSGGGGSGSIASSSGAGGSGTGVAETGFGFFNPKSYAVLMKQNQIYHQTSQKEQKIHYEQGAALTERISSCRISLVSMPAVLQPRYSLPAAGSHQPRAGCPDEVPATAMVTTPADVVDRSVPAVSVEPPAGTSSLANSAPTTF
jgi:hypothetical protein